LNSNLFQLILTRFEPGLTVPLVTVAAGSTHQWPPPGLEILVGECHTRVAHCPTSPAPTGLGLMSAAQRSGQAPPPPSMTCGATPHRAPSTPPCTITPFKSGELSQRCSPLFSLDQTACDLPPLPHHLMSAPVTEEPLPRWNRARNAAADRYSSVSTLHRPAPLDFAGTQLLILLPMSQDSTGPPSIARTATNDKMPPPIAAFTPHRRPATPVHPAASKVTRKVAISLVVLTQSTSLSGRRKRACLSRATVSTGCVVTACGRAHTVPPAWAGRAVFPHWARLA
jgi:hypothetical protein